MAEKKTKNENKERDQSILDKLDDILHSTLLESKKVYNVHETCLYLGLKPCYIYELVRNHKIPYFRSKGGKLLYFHREDLDNWALATPVPTIEQVADRRRRKSVIEAVINGKI